MLTKNSRNRAAVALAVLLLGLALGSSNVGEWAQWLFIHGTYYLLLLSALLWLSVALRSTHGLSAQTILKWAKENWPGFAAASAITLVAVVAIDPALRVLSDEANLVGTSKNLYTSHSATFTVSGKNYYGSYWDVDVAIDQRPPLFPFLVSLLHTALGYRMENAFLLNLLLLPAFILLCYRVAKSQGGEVYGITTVLLVAAHPVFLISVRSGGFDLLAAFFSILIIKTVLDILGEKSPEIRAEKLVRLWLHLCLFAQVRYESALFFLPVLAVLCWSRVLTREALSRYAWIYASTPALLAPRLWQAVIRGSVPPQEPGTVPFAFTHLLNHSKEYFLPLLDPLGSYPAHSAIVLALGVLGLISWSFSVGRELRRKSWPASRWHFVAFVALWMVLQATILFPYVWGRAQYPTAARLFLPIDTLVSFAGAWALLQIFGRGSVPVFLSLGILTSELPEASQARMMNRLTQTRESARTWSYFESLGRKQILIVTDRPNHFTILNYGAMNFEAARSDPYLLTALRRRLLEDVFVIQQIGIKSGQPLPGYEAWSDDALIPVLEFQNDADVMVRVSRLDPRVESGPAIGPPLPKP